MDSASLIRSLIVLGREIGLDLAGVRAACNTHSLRALSVEQLRAHRDRLEAMLTPEQRARRTQAIATKVRAQRRETRAAPGAIRNASPAQRAFIGGLIGQLADVGALTTSERVSAWLSSKGFPTDWQHGTYSTKTASYMIGALQRWLRHIQKADRTHDARAAGGNG